MHSFELEDMNTTHTRLWIACALAIKYFRLFWMIKQIQVCLQNHQTCGLCSWMDKWWSAVRSVLVGTDVGCLCLCNIIKSVRINLCMSECCYVYKHNQKQLLRFLSHNYVSFSCWAENGPINRLWRWHRQFSDVGMRRRWVSCTIDIWASGN